MCVCKYLYTYYLRWGALRPEAGVRSPGAGVTYGWDLSDMSECPSDERKALFTDEPSLESPKYSFKIGNLEITSVQCD